MEVMIKECMEALREIWGTQADYSPMKEMIYRHREEPLRKRYGIEVFMEAEKRLKAQGVKR